MIAQNQGLIGESFYNKTENQEENSKENSNSKSRLDSQRPKSIFGSRNNSEIFAKEKFFTTEGTPLRRMRTAFNIAQYERKRTESFKQDQ